MREQIKAFWKENKENIKTGTILVLAPIAVLGVMAAKSLDNVTNVLSTAAEMAKKDTK
jgi:hypothetical protein